MVSLRLSLPGLVLFASSVACAADKPILRPDPDWKGSPSELNYPSDWLAYFPTAKVGDFVEYDQGKFGRKREEVVSATADAIVVSRTIENATAKAGFMELRFQYKLQAGDKKKLADGTVPPAVKSKKPEFETIKIGDAELKCAVIKSGKTTRWYSPELPFDGIVKKESANDKFVVISFGRGK